MKDSKAFDNIPMPTQDEKEIAVAAILDTAMPTRPTWWEQLRQARQLPVSVLFFGVWDCLFLAVIIAFLCIMPIIAAVINHDLPIPLFFLVSPILYAATHGLTTWKDRMSGTLEWKLVCRISFRTLTTLRMLFFGGVATIFCVPFTLLLWTLSSRSVSLFWLLSLAFSSLFLYAALSILCQTHPYIPLLTAPGIWLATGILLMAWDRSAAFLMHIPAVVFCLIALIALLVIHIQMKKLISNTTEGGLSYAVR